MSEEKIFRTSEPRSCKITQKSPEKKFTGQKKIPPAAGTFPPFFYVRVAVFKFAARGLFPESGNSTAAPSATPLCPQQKGTRVPRPQKNKLRSDSTISQPWREGRASPATFQRPAYPVRTLCHVRDDVSGRRRALEKDYKSKFEAFMEGMPEYVGAEKLLHTFFPRGLVPPMG